MMGKVTNFNNFAQIKRIIQDNLTETFGNTKLKLLFRRISKCEDGHFLKFLDVTILTLFAKHQMILHEKLCKTNIGR